MRNAAWIAVAAVFAGSLLAALDYAHVGLLAALLVVAIAAVLAGDMPPALRAVWVLIAAGSPASSARSCSTCATSSTVARCSA